MKKRPFLLALAAAALLPPVRLSAGDPAPAASPPMQRVSGIGGFFFRAKDPAALAKWYEQRLGVDPIPSDYSHKPWVQEAGPTAFAPFPKDTGYFGKDGQTWMLNFRVSDLDAMVAQLRAAGEKVKVDPTVYPNGRFAHLRDPEGNPIELWEPKKGT